MFLKWLTYYLFVLYLNYSSFFYKPFYQLSFKACGYEQVLQALNYLLRKKNLSENMA